MKYPYYKDLEISENYHVYDFVSKGIKGDIEKRIIFQPIQGPYVFNLAFGDQIGNVIDDFIISDNNDMPMILATIAAAIAIFLNTYPGRYIYIYSGKHN